MLCRAAPRNSRSDGSPGADLDVIGMGSDGETADGLGRAGSPSWSLRSLIARRLLPIAWQPRRAAGAGQSLEFLHVAERVHRRPEALVANGPQATHLSEPPERSVDQLLARLE